MPNSLFLSTTGAIRRSKPRRILLLLAVVLARFASFSAEAQDDQLDAVVVGGGRVKFSKIFFVGGRCDDPDSWYSRWTAAGLGTIERVTQHFCSPFDDGQYAEYEPDFHRTSLRAAMDAAGDRKNESLIITGAFAGVDFDDALVEVLRSGMAVFQGDGVELNLTRYDLSPENVLYLQLVYEEKSAAATEVGLELCRLKGGNSYLRVAKFYMEKRPDLDARVDNVLAAFSRACPNTVLQHVWTLRGERPYINGAAEHQFSFKEVPDIIVTPTDDDAANLLQIAKKIVTPEEYSILSATGWDNSWPDLLAQRKILTTANQLNLYPKLGFWKTVRMLIDSVEEYGLNSTAVLRTELDLGNASSMNTTVLAISSDRVGFVLSGLLESYDARSQPSDLVDVAIGLRDVSITEVMPFEGKYDVVYKLFLAWFDPRLVWNPFLYNDTVEIEREDIWYPRLLHFVNEYEHDVIFQPPAVVSHRGHVKLEFDAHSIFLCDTIEDIPAFPFDKYHCSIVLGGSGASLNITPSLGLKIISGDPNFFMESSIETDEDEEGNRMILFLIAFHRKYFNTWVSLILPAILINMVGFISFWIPDVEPSVALGITALLCSLAFRETVEMPNTSAATWSEVFVMINVSYQAVTMFIIFCSYSFVGRLMNKYIGCIRPPCHHTCKRANGDDHSVVSQITTGSIFWFRNRKPQSLDAKPQVETAVIAPRTKDTEKHVDESVTMDINEDTEPSTDVEEFCGIRKHSQHVDPECQIVKSTETKRASTLRRRHTNVSELTDKADGSVQEPEGPSVDGLENGEEDFVETKRRKQNVDWFGRWYVVPSYAVVMCFMLVTGSAKD